MARRRRVLLGMGALLFGSGAMSVNASFQNSVTPGSDMRVVADSDEIDLDIQPGILFREGGVWDGSVGPDPTGSVSGGPNGETIKDSKFSGHQLFDGTDPNLDVENEYPAAAVDTSQPLEDSGMAFEVGIPLGKNDKIGNSGEGFLQVVNNTGTNYDIKITFNKWGDDAGGASDELTGDQIRSVFKFMDSSGNQISPNDGTEAPADSPVTVGSGAKEQIYIKYDTDTYEDNLKQAATSGSPFNQSDTTVDLVNEIKVGVPQ